MKRFVTIFLIAFALNVLWENLHSYLYASYRGGEITELILLRASFFDALLIVLMILSFLHISFFKKRTGVIVFIGILIAVCNELYGLGTARWAYNAFMPIIPFSNVGLTPALQLGLLGYLSYKIQEKFLL